MRTRLRLLEQVDRLRVREVLLGLAERRGLQDFGAGQQIGDDPLLPLEPAQADGLSEGILCGDVGGNGGGGSGGGARDHLGLQVLRDGGEAEVAMTVEVEEATEAARAHLALKHVVVALRVFFVGDARATSGNFAFSGRSGRAVEVREALWRQDGSRRCLFLLPLSILPMNEAQIKTWINWSSTRSRDVAYPF